MSRKTDRFGNTLPYESPNITGYESALEDIILYIGNQLLEGLSDSEIKKLLGPRDVVLNYIVPEINMYLKTVNIGLERVDGNSIKSLLNKVIDTELINTPVVEVVETEVVDDIGDV